MAREVHPCKKALTPECFKQYPELAKRVFAYRILALLTGLDFKKRLQKMKGVPLKKKFADPWPLPPPVFPIPPPFFPIAPPYLQPFSPGPSNPPPQQPEVPVMPAIRKAKINIATADDHEIIAAISGKKISITNIALTVGGETNITLKSGTTAISGAMDFGGTDEPRGMTQGLGEYPLQTTLGEAFVMASSLAVQVSGYVTYYLAE